MDVKNLYHLGAPIYDWGANYYRTKLYAEAMTAYDQALREHLSKGAHVLDLGCGTGFNLARLQSLNLPFGTYIGIDLSADMLARARQKFAQLPNIEFRQLDLLIDPLPEGPFDLVVSTNVFEHLPNARGVVEKAMECLRPGGAALIMFFIEDVGLGHNVVMRTLFRSISIRPPSQLEYRQFPGLKGEQRFPGRIGRVLVFLELGRPLVD